MSARQCWIVSGSTGEYSDACDWSVRVFTRREDADAFAAMANAWLRELHMHRDDEGGAGVTDKRWEIQDSPPEWDPALRIQYTGAAYVVYGPVPLVDEVSP